MRMSYDRFKHFSKFFQKTSVQNHEAVVQFLYPQKVGRKKGAIL